MTSFENNLALNLVNESFGDIAHSVAALLLSKSSYPFNLIAEHLNLEKKKLSHVLSILITHYLVEFKLNTKQIVEYRFNTINAIDRLKTARVTGVIKNFQNDENAEHIIIELYNHASLEMSSVLMKIIAKKFNDTDLKSKSADLNEIYSQYSEVMGSFNKLIADKFIVRLPRLFEPVDDDMMEKKPPRPKVPIFVKPNEDDCYYNLAPELKIEASRMKKSIDEDYEKLTCQIRQKDEDFGDNGIYWKINGKRVTQFFRDQALINALEKRIDKNAANILKTVLYLANSEILNKAEQNSYISKPVTAIDIQKIMRCDYKMDSVIVDKYLSVILQDSFKVLEKIGEFSGGAYCIDFEKALTNLCLSHIESYVREKYDSKSLRIFRVILDKSKLEQKQIEDFSMIPSKECKALVYNMLNDGLLSINELSKTSDHAPSRTYYLFNIDMFQITKKLLENSYKSMENLMIKRAQLTSENKRLLEKSHKLNNRIETLKAQGAEQSEIDYEKSMMSIEETSQLNSFTEHCNKIELAEIQLEETIFVFENYFYYHTVGPVIPTKK